VSGSTPDTYRYPFSNVDVVRPLETDTSTVPLPPGRVQSILEDDILTMGQSTFPTVAVIDVELPLLRFKFTPNMERMLPPPLGRWVV
jgi:hypothetical protein